MPSQTATDPEAPPQEQQPQESHADEKPFKKKTPRGLACRGASRREADRRRFEAFARAFSTPGAAYNNATKAAEMAGYSKQTAYSQGSRLLKRPRVRELIDRFNAEIAAKVAAENSVTVEYVKQLLIDGMMRCRAAEDRTNEREYIEDLGRTCGAFDATLHLDMTVKREYDAALEEQAHIVARMVLEQMGDKVLGLLAPAIEVSGEQRAVESTNAAQVGVEVGVGGDRPLEGSVVASGDAGEGAGEAQEPDHDGHPREEDGVA